MGYNLLSKSKETALKHSNIDKSIRRETEIGYDKMQYFEVDT